MKPRWVKFDLPAGLEELPHILYAGCDSVRGPGYRWDGSKRGESPRCVFQYTLEGRGEVRFHGRNYETTEGTAFVVDISDPETCYYYPPEGKKTWSFVYCVFSNFGPAVANLNAIHGPVYDFGGDAALANRIFELMDLPFVNALSGYDLCAGIVRELCRIAELQWHDRLADRAMKLIRERRGKPFSLKELSRDLGVSPEHLCRKFKSHFGYTPKRQHEKLMFEQLCDRLLNHAPIKSVARDFGFSDLSNFNKFFKRHCSITPGQFQLEGQRPLHDLQ